MHSQTFNLQGLAQTHEIIWCKIIVFGKNNSILSCANPFTFPRMIMTIWDDCSKGGISQEIPMLRIPLMRVWGVRQRWPLTSGVGSVVVALRVGHQFLTKELVDVTWQSERLGGRAEDGGWRGEGDRGRAFLKGKGDETYHHRIFGDFVLCKPVPLCQLLCPQCTAMVPCDNIRPILQTWQILLENGPRFLGEFLPQSHRGRVGVTTSKLVFSIPQWSCWTRKRLHLRNSGRERYWLLACG